MHLYLYQMFAGGIAGCCTCAESTSNPHFVYTQTAANMLRLHLHDASRDVVPPVLWLASSSALCAVTLTSDKTEWRMTWCYIRLISGPGPCQ